MSVSTSAYYDWLKRPGHKYLIQHSAGSGKSNSIAWSAHQLSAIHTAEGNKLFDSVIVVTDRTVLDDQLHSSQKRHMGGTVSEGFTKKCCKCLI